MELSDVTVIGKCLIERKTDCALRQVRHFGIDEAIVGKNKVRRKLLNPLRLGTLHQRFDVVGRTSRDQLGETVLSQVRKAPVFVPSTRVRQLKKALP